MPESVFENDSPPLTKSAARAARRAEKLKKKTGSTVVGLPLVARSERQHEFLEFLRQNESIFSIGPAGTGKTFLSARIAAQNLVNQKIEKIIVARVTASNTKNALGFLPGKLNDKLKPWLTPVLDGIRAEIGAHTMDQWLADGRLEIASFEHMRGRTFQNAFILLDEAQNASFSDLKLFLTRIGDGAQVVVTGDLDQIDVKDSGLLEIIKLNLRYEGPLKIVQFKDQDVVRSRFTKEWVRIFSLDAENKGLTTASNSMILDELPAFLHNPGMSRKIG